MTQRRSSMLDIPLLKDVQWDFESCGAACALKVIRFFKIRATLSSVRRRCGTDRKGYTGAGDIVRCLRFYGLRVRIHPTGRAKLSDLKKAIQAGRPPIVYYEACEHWVIVRGVGPGKVFISDPSIKGVARELLWVQSTRRFLLRWDRSAIEAWPRNST